MSDNCMSDKKPKIVMSEQIWMVFDDVEFNMDGRIGHAIFYTPVRGSIDKLMEQYETLSWIMRMNNKRKEKGLLDRFNKVRWNVYKEIIQRSLQLLDRYIEEEKRDRNRKKRFKFIKKILGMS